MVGLSITITKFFSNLFIFSFLVLQAESVSIGNQNEDFTFPAVGSDLNIEITYSLAANIILPQELLAARAGQQIMYVHMYNYTYMVPLQ